MRRKRRLQSLAVTPKPPFGKDAANDGFEPMLTNAAQTSNDCSCDWLQIFHIKNFRSKVFAEAHNV